MKIQSNNLLWTDGLAGLSVGVFTLALAGWLSRLYQVPHALLLLMAFANLIYGIYSTTLASRKRRPKGLILLLIFANFAWGLACFIFAYLWWDSASWIGKGLLIVEGVFVGGLAWIEWTFREQLWRTTSQ